MMVMSWSPDRLDLRLIRYSIQVAIASKRHGVEATMSEAINRQVRLKSRPVGIPQPEHFEIVTAPVPELAERQLLVRNEFLSVEPAMRGWVNAAANYSEPVGIGEVMRSFAAGTVVASRHPHYREGDKLMGMFGWQDFAVSDGASVRRKVKETDLPLSLSLGVLGLNGLTAYFGLLDVGAPRPGDTVVVSTAAGAVGSAVGQIARMMGCRTVGIAGGAIKTKLCRDEFGYDEAIDYKNGDLAGGLAAACPRGADVYFDNTAGAISDAVMARLAVGARVVVCGTASVSSWDPAPQGPRVERHLLVKRARISGMLVFDYANRFEEAIIRLADWVRTGALKYREEIRDGIETCPAAIAELYRGENLGKRLIRLG
jgi:NADPH-dependent curcumin reductase CurA